MSRISWFDLVARISTRTSSCVPKPCWNRANARWRNLRQYLNGKVCFIRLCKHNYKVSVIQALKILVRGYLPLWPSWAGRHQSERAPWAEPERRPLNLTGEPSSELYPAPETHSEQPYEGMRALLSLIIMAFQNGLRLLQKVKATVCVCGCVFCFFPQCLIWYNHWACWNFYTFWL